MPTSTNPNRVERLAIDGYKVWSARPEAVRRLRAFLDGSRPAERQRHIVKKSHTRELFLLAPSGEGETPLFLKRVWIRFDPEALYRRFLRGEHVFRLFSALNGATGQDFAHRVDLVAERWSWRERGWVSLVMMEVVAGESFETLSPLGPERIEGARLALARLHAAGLVSGDPSPGNFIETPAGPKLIDLIGKPTGPLRRAMDQVMFEDLYGASFPPHGAAYGLARRLRAFRLARLARKRARLRAKGR